MWQGGVGQGVAEGVVWRMLLGLLLGVSMVALDPGMRWRRRGRCWCVVGGGQKACCGRCWCVAGDI